MFEYLLERGPYLLFVLLVMIGMFLMMSQRNLLKAVVGLYLFQTAVILLFITLSFRPARPCPLRRTTCRCTTRCPTP
jgi:multisubunit Na+/H+ antiporter MnhC subunit